MTVRINEDAIGTTLESRTYGTNAAPSGNKGPAQMKKNPLKTSLYPLTRVPILQSKKIYFSLTGAGNFLALSLLSSFK